MLKTEQFCETSSKFELDNIKNETILRDFFNFRSRRHQKRSNSARLRSRMESWVQSCRADGFVPMRFAFFPFHLSKVLRLPRKREPRSYEVLHLSRKIILANLKIWCPKMQPLSGNQRPDLLTCLIHVRNASLQILFKCPMPANIFEPAIKPSRFHHFWQGAEPLARTTQNHIWTSKNSPKPSVFNTFDLEMCFAPQRCALFQHLNFQKWPETSVFAFFAFKSASRHDGVHFSKYQCQKWSKPIVFLSILTWTRASRRNRAHFCNISTSKSAPALRCFSHFDLETCFAPQPRANFHISSPQRKAGALLEV